MVFEFTYSKCFFAAKCKYAPNKKSENGIFNLVSNFTVEQANGDDFSSMTSPWINAKGVVGSRDCLNSNFKQLHTNEKKKVHFSFLYYCLLQVWP